MCIALHVCSLLPAAHQVPSVDAPGSLMLALMMREVLPAGQMMTRL